MERESNPFDTPIPGQSLTDTPKNYPWENPARFPSLEKASIHIWRELNKKDALKRVIVFSGFVEGAFSVDSALLLTPIVQKMILQIGKAAGVSKLKVTRPRKDETEAMISNLYKSRGYVPTDKAIKKAKKAIKEKPKGIMSRKKGDE